MDRFQVDVMDGRYVPNITFGTIAVRSLRPLTRLTIETHLMVTPPEDFIEAFADAGADTIIVHQESTPHLHRAIEQIRGLGKKAAVALNPSTPASTLSEVLDMVQMVLVMTVNPGFGGQSFIHECLPKIQQADAWRRQRQLNYRLEVDGGINNDTVAECARAGADTFVAGTALFRKPNLTAAVKKMRQIALQNAPAPAVPAASA